MRSEYAQCCPARTCIIDPKSTFPGAEDRLHSCLNDDRLFQSVLQEGKVTGQQHLPQHIMNLLSWSDGCFFPHSWNSALERAYSSARNHEISHCLSTFDFCFEHPQLSPKKLKTYGKKIHKYSFRRKLLAGMWIQARWRQPYGNDSWISPWPLKNLMQCFHLLT